MYFFSALTICLLAVLAIAAEARHVKKTQNRGNAKMLSLIEKMNKQRLPDVFPAQVEHYIGENDTIDFFFRLNTTVRLNTSAAKILIMMDIMTASAAHTRPTSAVILTASTSVRRMLIVARNPAC